MTGPNSPHPFFFSPKRAGNFTHEYTNLRTPLCDYIFYFHLSLEGGNNDGSYLHNMWGKKKPSYEGDP